RREVVAADLEVETALFSRNRIPDKVFGAALLRHQGIAEVGHTCTDTRAHRGQTTRSRRGSYRRSLTAADRRAPSAFPAAIAVAAFMTSPICFMVGRSPRVSATSAIAVSATSASSASLSGVGR